MRYFLDIEFKGTDYHGWQIQPNAISVQQVIEEALSRLLSDDIAIVGAGRTDAGVHALQMWAHFDSKTAINRRQMEYRLNSFLPKDIAIKSILPVLPTAHARFDATSRSYIYKVHTKKNVWLEGRSYYLTQSLDVDAMNEAALILLQYSDFECFSKSKTDVKTYKCDIKFAKWIKTEQGLEFHVTADRFLRNMVRAIVGTMINIGLGKIGIEELHNIIKSKNRAEAGYSVPACGLYLSQVTYPEDIWLKASHLGMDKENQPIKKRL